MSRKEWVRGLPWAFGTGKHDRNQLHWPSDRSVGYDSLIGDCVRNHPNPRLYQTRSYHRPVLDALPDAAHVLLEALLFSRLGIVQREQDQGGEQGEHNRVVPAEGRQDAADHHNEQPDLPRRDKASPLLQPWRERRFRDNLESPNTRNSRHPKLAGAWLAPSPGIFALRFDI